jgi:hypothetical protein
MELNMSGEVMVSPLASEDELKALGKLDPGELILNGGKKQVDFWDWIRLISRKES